MSISGMASGQRIIPDKITVYSADGKYSHTFTGKTWIVLPKDSMTHVYVPLDECPNWPQEGDGLIADNMDGEEVSEEVADIVIEAMGKRNESGPTPLMLFKGK